MIYIVFGNTNNIYRKEKDMNIRIEEVPKELKNEVVRIGGICDYYPELDECFLASFMHHELETQGDHVIITDDLTGNKLIIKRCDFYTIELI